MKNENEILPFDENTVKNVAVVGPLSDVWYKDWYCGIPPYEVTVLDGIREAFPNAKISHETGLSESVSAWRIKPVINAMWDWMRIPG